MIAPLESTLYKFEAEQADQQNRRDAAERRLADYEPRIGEPFEFEADLVERRAQHTQLETDLATQQDRGSSETEQDAVSTFEATVGVVIQFPGRGRIAGTEDPEEPDAADAEAE